MMFKKEDDGFDSLYVGPFNENGIFETDANTRGLRFADLDFSEKPLISHYYNYFFKGKFVNGLPQGKGELLSKNKPHVFCKMPLILTDN
jgi:hypothetical protein